MKKIRHFWTVFDCFALCRTAFANALLCTMNLACDCVQTAISCQAYEQGSRIVIMRLVIVACNSFFLLWINLIILGFKLVDVLDVIVRGRSVYHLDVQAPFLLPCATTQLFLATSRVEHHIKVITAYYDRSLRLQRQTTTLCFGSRIFCSNIVLYVQQCCMSAD